MLDCLILGDSIAVGTHMFRQECVAYAQVGINSHNWNKKWPNVELTAKTVVISLGSNDTKNINSKKELEILRKRVDAYHVFWILPSIKPDVQELIKQVASEYGDTIIPITHTEPDGIHPTIPNYKELAKKTL